MPRALARPAVVLLALASLAVPRTAATQTTDKAVYVSVLDEKAQPLTGLGLEAFAVREDGSAREVLRVSRAVQPVDVMLLVDNSQAATPHINDLRQALTAFVRRLAAGQHQVAIVSIADRPTVLQDYTTSAPALVRTVERIFAQSGSGTTLLDAIRDVSRGFGKRESERRAIVAITTEGTDFSNPNHQRALADIRSSGAAFHSLVLTRPGGEDLRSEEARSRGIVLDQGTRESGGRLQRLLSSMSLPTALDAVASELEQQYQVVYGRPGSLVPPEKIEVTVTAPGATVRWTPAATPARPAAGD
jgi:VWFA-related protein